LTTKGTKENGGKIGTQYLLRKFRNATYATGANECRFVTTLFT
jgi:hypothetical protein